MRTRVEGFSIVSGVQRAWNGVVADIWDVECGHAAGGSYFSPDPRLFVPLALEGGGEFTVGHLGTALVSAHRRPYSMSYFPADLGITGKARNLSRIRHLDIHIDEAALRSRFGRALPPEKLREPRFAFEDARIAGLARLIAEECGADDSRHDLYIEGLVNALLTLLFDVRPEVVRRRPGLSRLQLRMATDHIEANCLSPLRLADLADLVGLSETYFSHAFKSATGLSPHRWVMQARVRKAQQFLSNTELPLSAIAASSGFSDQAHLTRVFKAGTGTTPAAWRREKGGR